MATKRDQEFDSFPDTEEGVEALNEQAGAVVSRTRTTTVTGSDGVTAVMTDEALKDLSFADLSGLGIAAFDASDGTDQFGPILSRDKSPLVGVPCVFLSWKFNEGDFATDFVSVLVITQDDRKFILNDGSTGICTQLHHLTDTKGMTGMLACRKGLKRSDYEAHKSPDGRMVPAGTTYYIDTSL